MKEFFKASHDVLVGCDPGPEHSAFALVTTYDNDPKVIDLAYVPNRQFDHTTGGYEFVSRIDNFAANGRFAEAMSAKGNRVAYVFEKCGVQAGGANALVFETCMTAGVIRHFMQMEADDSYAFAPSDWRYVLTGKGAANDTMVRGVLLTITPECDILSRSYSTKAKKVLNLKKPITSHVRDAAGVALAYGLIEYRTGNDMSRFPARTEVHCG